MKITKNFVRQVCTLTLARSPQEEQRILKGINILAKKLDPIIVVDGGSSESFIAQLKQIPQVQLTVHTVGGIQEQAKVSLQLGMEEGTPLFYTESDKTDFFEKNLDEFMQQSSVIMKDDPNFGMILPSRNLESFLNTPSFQQHVEHMENALLRELTHDTNEQSDYTYGPRIISPELLPYLDHLTTDVGWGWMHFLHVVAYRLGKKIYTIPLNLPVAIDEQKKEQEKELYRLKQLRNFVDAMISAQTVDLHS